MRYLKTFFLSVDSATSGSNRYTTAKGKIRTAVYIGNNDFIQLVNLNEVLEVCRVSEYQDYSPW